MDILHIAGLQKRFGDKRVLDGLNLAVPEHSIFGFIGKNGAGKTTTMKMVLGFLKADAGGILVNGEKIVYGQTFTNRWIGYLPNVPEFYPFQSPKTADLRRTNVCSGSRWQKRNIGSSFSCQRTGDSMVL